MPRKAKNIVGSKYGRWTVISDAPKINGILYIICECSCGQIRTLIKSEVTQGRSKSCGCRAREVARSLLTKHGLSKTKTYKVWAGMKRRCTDTKHKDYANYGAKGVKVCDKWSDSFEAFIEDMGACPDGYTIERDNVYGDYSPDNCRWIPASDQSKNRRPRSEWKKGAL